MKLFLYRLNKYRVLLFIAFLVIVGWYGMTKALPPGVGVVGTTYHLPDAAVSFLVDETYTRADGTYVSDQMIFDEVLRLVNNAEHFILIDMFLWNQFHGATRLDYRVLSQELTTALIRKKLEKPEMQIIVISDPINTVYDGQPSYQFNDLRGVGIPVIMTNLSALRDSNPLYASLWRGVLQWPDVLHQRILGKPYTARWLPNIMNVGGEKLPLRSYLKLLNFKANHRKLIVADVPSEQGPVMTTLITSANPHDGSSRHSNVALRVEGGIWQDVIASEQAVAIMADTNFSAPTFPRSPIENQGEGLDQGEISVSLRTEKAIYETVITMLQSTNEQSTVNLAMFYLSEQGIVNALIDASKRGATVRVILDPNKDAFGREKNGIPNRSIAAELIKKSDGKISVRWCATNGEQCHGKLLLVSNPEYFAMTLGSANFTRRNLMNINLESNVYIESRVPSSAFLDAENYFNRMWNNEAGRTYTLAYEAYKDESKLKKYVTWIMERTGLSTF